MKTKSLNTLLNHKFFLYGMIFLSTVMLLNFFRNNSLACLGVFGVSYYIACLYLKNKGLCLLAAIVVSTILFGCENNIEGLMEGMHCDKEKTEGMHCDTENNPEGMDHLEEEEEEGEEETETSEGSEGDEVPIGP